MGFSHPPTCGRRKRDLFGLAPGGVYQATPIAQGTGELLPHLFTLTLWNRRIRHSTRRYFFCGTFLTPCEVAAMPTSQGTVRITDHPALWSSDFPPLLISLFVGYQEERPFVPLRLPSFTEISESTSKSLINQER